MDDTDPIADWDQEDGGIYLCPLAGWQSGINPEFGVALRVSFFASPEEIQRDAPSSVQLLLSAASAIEFGEEMIRQGRAAMGDVGQTH